MQLVSSKIWTRAAVSISYDDNDYTTGTSKKCIYKLYIFDVCVLTELDIKSQLRLICHKPNPTKPNQTI